MGRELILSSKLPSLCSCHRSWWVARTACGSFIVWGTTSLCLDIIALFWWVLNENGAFLLKNKMKIRLEELSEWKITNKAIWARQAGRSCWANFLMALVEAEVVKWNGPYGYNFKDSKDASKFWVGFSRMPSHVISIALGVLCRSQWDVYFQGASKNHRLINTCWNGPQEVSGPNCCSDQGQLWDQMRLLQALSWWVLEASKDTDCILPEHPFAVLDSSHGVPRCFGKTYPKSLITLHKFLAGCSSAVAKGQQQNS